MTKIKEIIYCEKRASSKTDNIYDTPEDRFHNVFSFRLCHGPRGIIPFLTISTCCQLNETLNEKQCRLAGNGPFSKKQDMLLVALSMQREILYDSQEDTIH
jgi:hypothetical protein